MTRHEVPPLSDGLYYATPVLLADCSESEESDTDTDAQTVIHTSPYSSPGGSKDIKSFTVNHTHESDTNADHMCFGVHQNPEVPSWEFDLTDISVTVILHEKWKSSGSTYCSTLGLGRLSLNFQSALGHFGTLLGFCL